MKKFLNKLETTDFRKPFQRLIIISLAVILVCGGLTAFMFRTQLTELAALDKAEEQVTLQNDEKIWNGEHNEDGEHSGSELNLLDSGLVTRPSIGSVATAIISVVLCGLCALAYWLMVAAWLYKASSRAGMNRALWSMLALAFNLAAVAVFLIVRGRLCHCESCDFWQHSAKYCVNCGAALQPVCPKCGKTGKASDNFCSECGTSLKANNSDNK